MAAGKYSKYLISNQFVVVRNKLARQVLISNNETFERARTNHRARVVKVLKILLRDTEEIVYIFIYEQNKQRKLNR